MAESEQRRRRKLGALKRVPKPAKRTKPRRAAALRLLLLAVVVEAGPEPRPRPDWEDWVLVGAAR